MRTRVSHRRRVAAALAVLAGLLTAPPALAAPVSSLASTIRSGYGAVEPASASTNGCAVPYQLDGDGRWNNDTWSPGTRWVENSKTPFSSN